MSGTYVTWVDQVITAQREKSAFNIVGGQSKVFYGGVPQGSPLDMTSNHGIVDYDPAELVIVVRSGTSLEEVNKVLASKGQMLGFEPPFAQRGATIGGAVASGLAGAGRPYRGGVRDFLLGVKIINGMGEVLQFGGRVMKNVAGFDVFRPMAGAMGTLGVLLEVSLRVMPIPESEVTLSFAMSEQDEALKQMSEFGQTLASISAAAWYAGKMYLRLSGSSVALKRDQQLLDKQFSLNESDSEIWSSLSSFEHAFFNGNEQNFQLAVINVPAATAAIDLPGRQFIDWAGARRYLNSSLDVAAVRARIQRFGGNAVALKSDNDSEFFQPLNPSLLALHKRLKRAFDPDRILNPGRLYSDL